MTNGERLLLLNSEKGKILFETRVPLISYKIKEYIMKKKINFIYRNIFNHVLKSYNQINYLNTTLIRLIE